MKQGFNCQGRCWIHFESYTELTAEDLNTLKRNVDLLEQAIDLMLEK